MGDVVVVQPLPVEYEIVPFGCDPETCEHCRRADGEES